MTSFVSEVEWDGRICQWVCSERGGGSSWRQKEREVEWGTIIEFGSSPSSKVMSQAHSQNSFAQSIAQRTNKNNNLEYALMYKRVTTRRKRERKGEKARVTTDECYIMDCRVRARRGPST
jgi:hypothetical protein